MSGSAVALDDFDSYALHAREQTITIERQRAKLDTARALVERLTEQLNDTTQNHRCPNGYCEYAVTIRRATEWLTTP
jgi:hypothetical protein